MDSTTPESTDINLGLNDHHHKCWSVIIKNLNIYGFTTPDDRDIDHRLCNLITLFDNTQKAISFYEKELTILNTLNFIRGCRKDGMVISNKKCKESLEIDGMIIDAFANGLGDFYKSAFRNRISSVMVQLEHIRQFEPSIEIDEDLAMAFCQDSLMADLQELKEFDLKGNALIGMMAQELYIYLHRAGIFKGSMKGKGITTKMACIFDILDGLGFKMKISEPEPHTPSIKYGFLKNNCIKLFKYHNKEH